METRKTDWIVHLDMDAFYASVEQRDTPAYRGKPLIIGGISGRGVVATCSYEARAFGVHSAMPTAMARKLCPQAIFLHPRMEYYQEVSEQVMQILHTYSPVVEQASIDEAYLDLGGFDFDAVAVESRARQLQQEIYTKVQLSCSMGIAPVKFLSKIASDMQKPAGLTLLRHEQVTEFLATLPVRKIPGVGKKMQAQLELLSVHTAADVLRYPVSFWLARLGKAGEELVRRAQGIDERAVTPYVAPKSESTECTLEVDTDSKEVLARWLYMHATSVGRSLRKAGRMGRTITIKIKYADFTQITRSRTLEYSTNTTKVIYETAHSLLQEEILAQNVRLIGLGVSQFGSVPKQLHLFDVAGEEQDSKEAAIDATLDALQEKFGTTVVFRGAGLIR